jgi:hypothetical protein
LRPPQEYALVGHGRFAAKRQWHRCPALGREVSPNPEGPQYSRAKFGSVMSVSELHDEPSHFIFIGQEPVEWHEARPVKVLDIVDGVRHIVCPIHQLRFGTPLLRWLTRAAPLRRESCFIRDDLGLWRYLEEWATLDSQDRLRPQ